MKIDRDFHMMKGDDEFSYAENSRIQRRAILTTRPMVEKAVREMGSDLHPQSMTIVDLAMAGSFYTRLFPSNSVHFFHSSMSVMWLSQVPENLDGSMNKGNVYIGATTPPMVTKLYQNQFEKDFLQFLRMRCKEIVPRGRMVLTLVGRRSKDVFDAGRTTIGFELLSQVLRTLVAEGRVEKEKLDSFNIPIYCASVDELKQLVCHNDLIDISDIQLFEMDGNCMDDPEPVEGPAAAQAIGQSTSATLIKGGDRVPYRKPFRGFYTR
ncbi:hypothetical protein DAI22_11g094800 [Oryza sativa Japonica Group]|nr:hypothetical protein DAI22_11g094800 [Oryza sativa Japonica Group]